MEDNYEINLDLNLASFLFLQFTKIGDNLKRYLKFHALQYLNIKLCILTLAEVLF